MARGSIHKEIINSEHHSERVTILYISQQLACYDT